MNVGVPILSQSAKEITPAVATDGQGQTEWVLQRARVLSAGLRLAQHEVDEIGISLKHRWITPERAASDLALLEQLPLHVASIFYRGGGE